MSRATWLNPLTWQEEEQRGPLVDVLDELTRGTSRWDETAVYLPFLDAWLMCWKYSWPPLYDVVYEWCTTSNGPEPPPPPPPGPPPPGYPDDFEGLFFTLNAEFGTTTCWGPFPDILPEWDPSLGPWGGWRAVWFSGFSGDLTLEVYAVEWVPGAVTWRCRWSVAGSGSGARDVVAAAGFAPTFEFDEDEIPNCPGSHYTLVCTVVP